MYMYMYVTKGRTKNYNSIASTLLTEYVVCHMH